jgi:hypothetical protein
VSAGVVTLDAPRVTPCGSAAVLLDAEGPLALPTQERVWKLAREVRDWAGVADLQPGMNSLLVTLDPLVADAEALGRRLLEAWARTEPGWSPGRTLDVGVVYGGKVGRTCRPSPLIMASTPKRWCASMPRPNMSSSRLSSVPVSAISSVSTRVSSRRAGTPR